MVSHRTPLQGPSRAAPGQEDAPDSTWTEPEIAGNGKGQARSKLCDRSADRGGVRAEPREPGRGGKAGRHRASLAGPLGSATPPCPSPGRCCRLSSRGLWSQGLCQNPSACLPSSGGYSYIPRWPREGPVVWCVQCVPSWVYVRGYSDQQDSPHTHPQLFFPALLQHFSLLQEKVHFAANSPLTPLYPCLSYLFFHREQASSSEFGAGDKI